MPVPAVTRRTLLLTALGATVALACAQQPAPAAPILASLKGTWRGTAHSEAGKNYAIVLRIKSDRLSGGARHLQGSGTFKGKNWSKLNGEYRIEGTNKRLTVTLHAGPMDGQVAFDLLANTNQKSFQGIFTQISIRPPGSDNGSAAIHKAAR